MRGLRTTFRRSLMAGVAVAALATAHPALAEDPVTGPKLWRADSFWMELEGSYLWTSGDKQPWISDNLSGVGGAPQTLFSVRGDHALSGKIEIGFKINQRLDMSLAYTGLRESKKSSSRSHTGYLYNVLGPVKSFYDGANVETRSIMHVVDFEVGYEVGLGSRGLARLHAGLRFAHFGNNTDTELLYPGQTLYGTESLNNQTWGIGPRIGASGKFRVARTKHGLLSLVGAVSGAVLFGRTSTSIAQEYVAGGSLTYNDTSAKTLFNVDAKLGISYAFPLGAWGASLTLGYRGTLWWNVANTKTTDNFGLGTFPTQFPGAGTKNGNRYYHGPFLNFRINF